MKRRTPHRWVCRLWAILDSVPLTKNRQLPSRSETDPIQFAGIYIATPHLLLIIVSTKDAETIEPGHEVILNISPSHLHFFDPEDGRRIAF